MKAGAAVSDTNSTEPSEGSGELSLAEEAREGAGSTETRLPPVLHNRSKSTSGLRSSGLPWRRLDEAVDLAGEPNDLLGESDCGRELFVPGLEAELGLAGDCLSAAGLRRLLDSSDGHSKAPQDIVFRSGWC